MSRPVRWLITAVAVVAIIGVGVGLAALTGDRPPSGSEDDDAAVTTTPSSTSTTTPAERCPDPPVATGVDPRTYLPATGVYLGASVPLGPFNPPALDAFDQAAGRPAALILWFLDWTTAFPAEGVETTVARGAIPVLSWDPTASTDTDANTDTNNEPNLDQPAYRLATIINGDHDGYIREFADGARESCELIVLRFASEMNGNWHPWAEQVNANQAGEFVLAWRHVHDIFVEEGATNVSWFWNPNVDYRGSTPITGLYPGEAYVDWVGLSGYNWGTVNPWNRWRTFAEIFDQTLGELAELTDKPVLIGETASTEEGGDKAAWIADMFASLLARPQILGFVWFEYLKETDWRIVSSPPSQAAFAASAAQPYVLSAPVPS